ncbi:MAG TPA: NAD(P)-dependent oxidoreductase [Acidobacteriota bacterium]|nr:NAD(P)-dependent oxidoreductase [Acidobacteriota bacterium]
MSTTLGFIGTGNMGLPIARNLLGDGYPLRIFNRTAEKAASLATLGARLVSSPSQTAEPGGIVFTMLADDRALEEVAVSGDALAKALGPGGIHVSMGTLSPAAARKVAEHHRAFEVSYLAAPVFGRPEAADARTLWICLSGAHAAKDRVEPILKLLGRSVTDFGEDPGAANVVKLGGNFLLASAVEAMAEMIALAEKNGIAREKMIDLMASTLFACPVYQIYGRALVAQKYRPAGFRMELGLKDITLVLQTAAASKAPMPMASLVRDRLLTGVAKGRGDWDFTAFALAAAEDAGIKIPE